MYAHQKINGFSLIEAMAALAISGIILVTATYAYGTYFKYSAQLQVKGARSAIVDKIRTAAQDLNALAQSSKLQPKLAPCLQFSLTGPECQSRNSDGSFIEVPFTLVSPYETDVKIAGPESTLTGDASQTPVYYTKEGQLCTPELADPMTCPIQAIVSFIPLCQGGEISCRGAEAIQVIYKIELRPEYLAAKPTPFRPSTGSVFTTITSNQYIKILDARADSGDTISEIEMAKGEMLLAGTSQKVHARVALRDHEPLDEIEVRGWYMPSGCNFSNIGSSGCERPTYDSYQELTSVSLDPDLGPSVGQYTIPFIVDNSGFAEIVVLSKYQGNYIRRSTTALRLDAPAIPVVSVTGPGSISDDCDGAPYTFTFQAKDDVGLIAYSAKVTPALPSGANELPGFSFNLSSDSPQDYQITYDKFDPGVNYTIEFTVKNTGGIERSASHTFSAKPLPTEKVTFTAPMASAFLRPTDPLTAKALVEVQCGKTVSSMTFETAKVSGGNWMPPQSVSCSPTTTIQNDRDTFLCEATYTCEQWLNLSDCSSYSGPDETEVRLTGKATTSSSDIVTGDVEFIVGSYISVSFVPADTQFVIADNQYDSSSLPIRLQFSAVPTDAAYLSLEYTSGPVINVTCPAGNLICNVPGAPAPTVDSAIQLKVQTASKSLYVASAPDISQVDVVTKMNDCSQQAQPVTCPSGQTRKIHLSKLGVHEAAFSPAFDQTIDVKPDANIDFLIINRRLNPEDASEKLSFRFQIDHYSADGSTWLASTSTSGATQPSNESSQYLYVSDDYWRLHYNNDYFDQDRVSVRCDGTGVDTVIIRQCYCE